MPPYDPTNAESSPLILCTDEFIRFWLRLAVPWVCVGKWSAHRILDCHRWSSSIAHTEAIGEAMIWSLCLCKWHLYINRWWRRCGGCRKRTNRRLASCVCVPCSQKVCDIPNCRGIFEPDGKFRVIGLINTWSVISGETQRDAHLSSLLHDDWWMQRPKIFAVIFRYTLNEFASTLRPDMENSFEICKVYVLPI